MALPCNLPSWAAFHKVTWFFDYVIFRDHVTNYNHYISTTTVPVTIKLGRMVNNLGELWLYGLARSLDKLKPLSLQYHDAYGHQTWKGCDLPCWDPTYKVTWLFDYVILWYHVPQFHMERKLVRMVTYLKRLVPIKSHNHTVMLS